MSLENKSAPDKSFFRGAATTGLTTTLYTVGANLTAKVLNIVVTNTASSPATFDISLDGVKVFAGTPIAANSTMGFDLAQTLGSAKIIAGGASATTVNFHISGTETI